MREAMLSVTLLLLALFMMAFPVVALTSPHFIPLTLLGIVFGFVISIIVILILKRN